MRGPAKKRSYHHGDLRAALIDTAVELIAERGVRDFSLAEASRRLGVTVAAPYRHFADREALLAAAAVRASEALAEALAAVPNGLPPEERLAGFAAAYVRFAAENRPLFETLFAAGLDKSRHPELEESSRRTKSDLITAALMLSGGDHATAEALVIAVATAAHGHATLLMDGGFGLGPEAVDLAVAQAAAVTRAVIAGRSALGQ